MIIASFMNHPCQPMEISASGIYQHRAKGRAYHYVSLRVSIGFRLQLMGTAIGHYEVNILSSSTPQAAAARPLDMDQIRTALPELVKTTKRRSNTLPTPKMGDPGTQVADRDTTLRIIDAEFAPYLPEARPSRWDEIKEKTSLYPVRHLAV